LKNNLSLLLSKDFSQALQITHSKIERLQDDVYRITRPEVIRRLTTLKQTIDGLERLNDKFLFYLQLSNETPGKRQYSSCSAREVIERNFNYFAEKYPNNRVILDLVDSNIPISADAFNYVVSEFLEYAFDDRRGTESIYIHCRPIDGSFHFWLDRKAIAIDNARLYRQARSSEIALQQSERKYQKLSENVPGVIF
jgi:hypothetical protein